MVGKTRAPHMMRVTERESFMEVVSAGTLYSKLLVAVTFWCLLRMR